MSESKARLKVLDGGLGVDPEKNEACAATVAELVLEHLELADALARRNRVPGHDLDDIRQVARLGLVKAARQYREGAGHGFVQYAAPTITGTIKHYLRDQSWVVRPPRAVQELRLGVRAAHGRLEQDLGREPSVEELCEATGATAEKVVEAKSVNAAMSGVAIEPLDATPDEENRTYVLSDVDPGFEQVEQRELVNIALKGLNGDDLRLVKMRFVHEMSQSEIAAELGVSQMQVSRLLRRLLDRMRRRLAA
ncbi:hypothetical protein GCM10027449_09880 [Sinomonas notoginsengisoli]|uniref:sigma-70 family RNA polymerase sigma factor n=1 Tax=Sinomonas notoginsengisoli TaxID=1457311 RepID=UPI001F363CF3|nr:sigma-70 family RNA polymerase sigma factor [Sinomonas notoginsengisoli]